MVKKKIKNKKRIILFSLVFIAILVVSLFSFGSIQEILGGFESLSLSEVDVKDAGSKIILIGTVGQGADVIDIDWSREEINNKLTGYEVDSDVRGRIELKNLQHIYPTTQQRDKVYYVPEKETFDTSWSVYPQGQQNAISRCEELGAENTQFAYIKSSRYFWQSNTLICVKGNEYGRNAIPSGEGYTDFKVDFNIGGDSETMSRDNQVISLLNGRIKASYEGSLQALDTLDELNYNVLYRNSRAQHLISKSAVNYADENSLQNSVFSCVPDRTPSTENYDDFERCLNRYPDLPTEILDSKNNEFVDSNRIVRNVGVNNDNIVVDLEPQTQEYPVVKLEIDADWIGLDPQEAQPEITKCVSEINMDSGDEVIKSYTLKNTGNEFGNIIFSGECNNDNIDIFGSAGGINAGESRDFDVRITATAEKSDQSGTCDINVKDENSGASDTCSFNVNVNKVENICKPGDIKCNTETGNLQRCSDDGNSYVLYKECEKPCGYNQDVGDYTCGESGADPIILDCSWYQTNVDGECKTPVWVYFVGGGLIILLIIGVVITNRRKPVKRRVR